MSKPVSASRKLVSASLSVLMGLTMATGIFLLPKMAQADTKPGGHTKIYADYRFFGFCLGHTHRICEERSYHQ